MDAIRIDINSLIVAIEENTRVTNFLRTEMEENTELCRKLYTMLSHNNEQTNFLYDRKRVDLTGEQLAKNFGLGILQNVIGNGIFTE